ncbi:MAG: CBS domain-containing protein [Nitrospinaceae bacterium]
MQNVGDYMSSPVKSIDAESTVNEAASRMAVEKIGALLVKKDGEFAGIVTETDITRKVVGGNMDPKNTKVSEVMNAPIISIDHAESMPKANEAMFNSKIRHLVVTGDDETVGVLSVKDLVRYYENWFKLTL